MSETLEADVEIEEGGDVVVNQGNSTISLSQFGFGFNAESFGFNLFLNDGNVDDRYKGQCNFSLGKVFVERRVKDDGNNDGLRKGVEYLLSSKMLAVPIGQIYHGDRHFVDVHQRRDRENLFGDYRLGSAGNRRDAILRLYAMARMYAGDFADDNGLLFVDPYEDKNFGSISFREMKTNDSDEKFGYVVFTPQRSVVNQNPMAKRFKDAELVNKEVEAPIRRYFGEKLPGSDVLVAFKSDYPCNSHKVPVRVCNADEADSYLKGLARGFAKEQAESNFMRYIEPDL